MVNFNRIVLFVIFILVCVINIFDVDSAAIKEDDVLKVQRRKNYTMLQLMGNIAGALGRQDYVQSVLDAVRIGKKNKANGKYMEGAFILSEAILNTVHPLYVFLFPSKEDKGSLGANLKSGMGSWLETARRAGQAVKLVDRALGFFN